MPSRTVPSHTLRVQVTCPLPCRPDGPPFEFGVQAGRDTLHPGQSGAEGLVTFEAIVTAVRRADGSIRYRGPFVHGPSTEQILYLSVREVGADPTQWARRFKVRLPALTWEQLTALPESAVLATELSGERSRTVPLHTYTWTRRDAGAG